MGAPNQHILANYTLQIGNETKWIARGETATIFNITNGPVTTVTFAAVNTCGQRGDNVTLVLPDFTNITSTATQTATCYTSYIAVPLGLLLILTLVVIIILIVVLVYIIMRKDNPRYKDNIQ